MESDGADAVAIVVLDDAQEHATETTDVNGNANNAKNVNANANANVNVNVNDNGDANENGDDAQEEEEDEAYDDARTESDVFDLEPMDDESKATANCADAVAEGSEEDEADEAEEQEGDAEEGVRAFFQASASSLLADTTTASTASAVAPPFPAVHRSWEAFDAQLKGYARASYQLYVVRTTTSVNRRNLRIAELAAATGSTNTTMDKDTEAVAAQDDDDDEETETLDMRSSDQSDRLMIPAHLKWYSKTMMCTHGWKDRHRGTGKRSLTMVRSTGCPVKMCITLQHIKDVADDGDEDDDGWRAVVTKHVRTHNHPLSKELYLFYTENRRIYDPELLALVGGSSPGGGTLAAEFYGAFGEDDDEHTVGTNTSNAPGQDETVSVGGSVALMAPKAFPSWEQFHDGLAEYSLTTQQHFRIRSTISTQSKNAKALEQAGKTGKTADDIAVHLVPDAQKWFSKLLICNHGWKRKSRSKAAKLQRQGVLDGWTTDANPAACPAMIMARLQRDIHDNWRVVINRQIVHHNHGLYALDMSEGDADVRLMDGMASDLEEGAATGAIANAPTATLSAAEEQQHEEFVNAAVRHLGDLQLPASSTAGSEQDHSVTTSIPSTPATAIEPPAQPRAGEVQQAVPRPMSVVTEVVVRVAKLPAIHESWETFHACLQQYSESTYQSYRTRTTSSVTGRNQKIAEMRASNDTLIGNLSDIGEEGSAERDAAAGADSTRLIPEHYKWYSKTLTCTHGWKERRRGAGKRTIHIVRSTLCPVKICATLQYLEVDLTNSGDVGWRVVVTKHIVDHNHNLSKELFQHYCENRRIYDPALLAIDQSKASPATNSSSSAQAEASTASTRPAAAATAESSAMVAAGQNAGLFASGAPVGFDQSDAFNTPHGLPESAYMVPHPANPSQQIMLMPNGLALVSYTTVPASTTAPLQASTTTAAIATMSTTMQQMLAQGSMFPNTSFSSMLTSMPEPASNSTAPENPPTANAMCQLHGNHSAQGASPECTCLRAPFGLQLTTPAATAPAMTEVTGSSGKRRARGSQARHDDGAAPASKRFRTDPDASDKEDASDPFDASADGTTMGSHHNSSGPPAQLWSLENPVQVMTVTEADGTVLWRAPRLERRHESWTAFTAYLDAYSKSTYQLYRVRTTSSIAARNTRIFQQLHQMQQDGGRRIEPADDDDVVPHFVPTTYEWYSKTYVCTHGWKERRRGKGQRVSHNLRSTACPVKLCVTLQRDPHAAANWNVVVTKHILDHNHEISPTLFHSYSENRRIKDPQLLAQAEQMWRDGHPRREVFEFLKVATNSNLVMKDIHNLVQRWQQQQPVEPSCTTAAVPPPQPSNGRAEPEAELELTV